MVKVVVGDAGYAIHFSRSPMPFPRVRCYDTGVIRIALIRRAGADVDLSKTYRALCIPSRISAKVQQTTADETRKDRNAGAAHELLEDGARIKVVDAAGTSIGVDTHEDLEHVRRGFGRADVDCDDELRYAGLDRSRIFCSSDRRCCCRVEDTLQTPDANFGRVRKEMLPRELHADGASMNALQELMNPEAAKAKEVITQMKEGRYQKKKREGKAGGTDETERGDGRQ